MLESNVNRYLHRRALDWGSHSSFATALEVAACPEVWPASPVVWLAVRRMPPRLSSRALVGHRLGRTALPGECGGRGFVLFPFGFMEKKCAILVYM